MMKVLKCALPAIATIIFYASCNNSDSTSVGVEKDSVARPMSIHHEAMMAPMDAMMNRMIVMRLTGDFDYDFAGMLIQHNRGASGMAGLELENGIDEKVKELARHIIRRNETAEIQLMQFLKSARPSALKNNQDTIHHAFQDVIANTVVRMKGIMMTGNTDKDFIMMMIPHHEASNGIYKAELENGKSTLLKQLANTATTIQKRELDSLHVWAFENSNEGKVNP